MSTRLRLLLLITEDWYFWSHRLDVARAARDAAIKRFEFTVVTVTVYVFYGKWEEAK